MNRLQSALRGASAVTAFGTLVLAPPSFAQGGPPAAAQPWTREVIKSLKLNEERPVFVATPADYPISKDRYAVLVILDAEDDPQFRAALANIAFLASRRAIPPLIVVGIPNGKDRSHDLTPAATANTASRFTTAGGADAFAQFIETEVLPEVRKKYRTLTTTILAGHSFGGLIALDIAAKQTGVFNGIVSMSPSLWWNDESSIQQYADALQNTKTRQRLFVTSGALEPETDRIAQRFIATLNARAHPSVHVAYKHYPDATHGLTPQPSLIDGLSFVFAPVSMTKLPIATLSSAGDSAAVVRALALTEQQYAEGARALGLSDTRVPEYSINNLGYSVLQGARKPALAVMVFRRNVALYPESSNVYDSLGDGLLAKGDTVEAIKAFEKAVDVGTRSGLVVKESRDKLEALRKRSR